MMHVDDAELTEPLVQSTEEKPHKLPLSHLKNEFSHVFDSSSERLLSNSEEETKESSMYFSQEAAYKSPSTHPFIVPQYQRPTFNDVKDSQVWGESSLFNADGAQDSTVDIIFSGLYTLATAFTIFQGFGMLLNFTIGTMSLGLFMMLFGAIIILYDLKGTVNGVSVEMYFPFLGNYFGRAMSMLFLAILCGQVDQYAGWTKFVVLTDLLVALLQGAVYLTMKTTNPLEASALHSISDV